MLLNFDAKQRHTLLFFEEEKKPSEDACHRMMMFITAVGRVFLTLYEMQG